MEEISPKKSKWGKVGNAALILLTMLLCIAGIAYSFTDVGKAAGQYDKNHDEAVKLGMVFDAKSCAALYQVPEGEDAYPAIMVPLKALSEVAKDSYPPTLTDDQFLQRWSGHEADFLSLENVAKAKHFVDQTDLSTHQKGTDDHFALLKGTIKSLMFRLRIASKQNDFALAQRICRLASKLVASIDEEPVLYASLVRVACESIAHVDLKVVLAHHGTEEKWQDLLAETLATLDKPYDFRPGIRREHWDDLHGALVYLGSESDPRLQTPTEGNGFDGGYGGIPTEIKLLRLVPRYKRATIARMEEGFNITLRDYPKDLNDIDAITKSFRNADDALNHEGLSYKLTQMVIMSFEQMAKSVKSTAVQRYTILQALTLLSTHQDPNKGLPLKGRFALDLDGAPLRIKHFPKGWIVYSVGRNRTDDGGIRDSSSSKDDYVVNLSPGTIVPPKKPSRTASTP
jgi:hypothetical protein